MERGLAVHAGGDAQPLTRRRHRRTWMFALALVSIAGAAEARPRRRDARAAFERGLVAYQKGNFEAASEALGKSFELERDVDTLYAWAQAERKLDHCDKASELYAKLLGLNLPKKNRVAVERNLEECRALIAQPPGKVDARPVDAAPGEAAPPAPELVPPGRADPADADDLPPPAVVGFAPVRDPGPGSRAWYRDPVGLGLVGAGVVASGVGVSFLLSARSLDRDSTDAPTLDAARSLVDRARSRGTLGLVTAGAGGALVVGGVVWLVLHRRGAEQPTVTGWLDPEGGGLAVAGAF